MKTITLTMAACLLLAAMIIAFAVYDSQKWAEFKTAHHCKVVARVSGDWLSTTTVDARGNLGVGMTHAADKTGWLCDDGIIYYR